MRALKGVVRLQAIVRGRAVRRRIFATLKRLQSNSIRTPEAHERISLDRDQCYKDGEKKTLFRPNKDFEEKEVNVSKIIQTLTSTSSFTWKLHVTLVHKS